MDILLTLHSAKALKKSKLSSITKPYVRIFIDGYPTTLRTNTDREHGSDPVWEFCLKMELQQPYTLNAVVVFDIMHDSSTQIDRSLGKVKVPVKHFMSGEAGHDKRLIYKVHLSSGETMGELIMSHQQNIISVAPMINTAEGKLQAYLPTLEVPNDRPRHSWLSSFNGIGLVASCLSIYENVQDMI